LIAFVQNSFRTFHNLSLRLSHNTRQRSFIHRNWRSIFIFLTLFVDTLSIVASAFCAYSLRGRMHNLSSVGPESLFLIVLAFWGALILFGLVVGLYRAAYHTKTRHQYFLAAKSYVLCFLVTLASFYILRFVEFPRKFTLLFFFFLPFLFMLGRSLLNRFNLRMQKKGFGIYKALVVGYGNDGKAVFNRFRGFPELGYDIKGYVSATEGTWNLPIQLATSDLNHESEPAVPHYSMSVLENLIKEERINGIFIPSTSFVTNGSAELVEVCKRERIKLKILSPEADELLKLAHVFDVAGITLYSPPRTKIESVRRAAKRAFDVLGSLFLMIILSPVFLLTALAIYLESGSPVIFKQTRALTKHGKTFPFLKFRSMVKHADELKGNLLPLNESNGGLFKMKKDPRSTKVGRFIRRFSIDELPQFLNVLKGDMSLVGPRPLPLEDFDHVEESPELWEVIKDRERLKPGVTGLWQVSGRSHLGFREMLLLDAYYVDNHSILLDLEILFETVPVVLLGRGAY
jgi:exopolysaccharide biosynthesis polyprenyl glycosylphosphotransferase